MKVDFGEYVIWDKILPGNYFRYSLLYQQHQLQPQDGFADHPTALELIKL